MFGGTTIYGNPHMMVNKVTSPHSPRYLPGESASIRSLFGEKKDLQPPENEDDNGKRKPWMKMSARSCWFTAYHIIAVILWFVGVYYYLGERITVLFEINQNWVVATQIFVIFTTKIGEDEPILTIIFFKWVVQPPTRKYGAPAFCMVPPYPFEELLVKPVNVHRRGFGPTFSAIKTEESTVFLYGTGSEDEQIQ